MIALDAALRRLTVGQLTLNRAEMAVAFGRGCGFASGRLLGATGPPDGILQLEGEANFSLSWGMKRTQKLLCMGCG